MFVVIDAALIDNDGFITVVKRKRAADILPTAAATIATATTASATTTTTTSTKATTVTAADTIKRNNRKSAGASTPATTSKLACCCELITIFLLVKLHKNFSIRAQTVWEIVDEDRTAVEKEGDGRREGQLRCAACRRRVSGASAFESRRYFDRRLHRRRTRCETRKHSEPLRRYSDTVLCIITFGKKTPPHNNNDSLPINVRL